MFGFLKVINTLILIIGHRSRQPKLIKIFFNEILSFMKTFLRRAMTAGNEELKNRKNV